MKNGWIGARVINIFRFTQQAKYIETAARGHSALSFRLRGKSFFGAKKGEQLIDAGTVLLVPAGISYKRQCLEDEEIIVFHFTAPETIGGEILSYRGPEAEEYRRLFELALEVQERKEVGYQFEVMSLFYQILAMFACHTATEEHEMTSPAEPAAQMMQKEFSSSSLTVGQIAEQLGISEAYLRRTFSQVFGMPPKQYLLSLRIDHAKELLLSGYYTQEEIAHRCGFDDVKYFRTAFKHRVGMSPATYLKADR